MTACRQMSQPQRLRLYGQPVPEGMVLGWSCQTLYCGNPEHFCLRPNQRAGDRHYAYTRKRLAQTEVGGHIDLPRQPTDRKSLVRFRAGLQSGTNMRFVVRTLPRRGVRIFRLPDWHPGEPWQLDRKETLARYPLLGGKRT